VPVSRLQRCDREIAESLAAAGRMEYMLVEQIAILVWELDWRSERDSILAECRKPRCREM
jgi:hypothetical protein